MTVNGYRRGAVFGLTVAEIFILLTFLLLLALLGLTQKEEQPPQAGAPSVPRVWVRPEKIETLVRERDQAKQKAEAARMAQERAEAAHAEEARAFANTAREAQVAREKAEADRAAAERERDQAKQKAEAARMAQERAEAAHAEEARAFANTAREAQVAREKAEAGRIAAERDRNQAQHDLSIFRRKGDQPPCWYTVVSHEGKTRERREYIFDVAIYEDGIELAPKPPPPGGAFDDEGDTYANERKHLQIENLPYGRKLGDEEFRESVKTLAERGENRQVRTYPCLFSVRVWDMTPVDAKKRWKHVHDNLIEGLFNAYTVKDDPWTGGQDR